MPREREERGSRYVAEKLNVSQQLINSYQRLDHFPFANTEKRPFTDEDVAAFERVFSLIEGGKTRSEAIETFFAERRALAQQNDTPAQVLNAESTVSLTPTERTLLRLWQNNKPLSECAEIIGM